jgi:hypothetical protein
MGGSTTPYTAPEILQGRRADARTDIFAFGAIVFEMMTGRRAFEGEARTTLAANLINAPAPESGSPALDRLVARCLVKNPEGRTARMQMIALELKLLSVGVRRGESGGTPESRQDMASAATLRHELQQVEARIAARLQNHEKLVTEVQRSASEAVRELKSQVSTLTVDFAVGGRPVGDDSHGLDDAAEMRVMTRVDRALEAVGERVSQLERKVDDMHLRSEQFERSVAMDLLDIEEALKAQTSSIESTRTAMSQTDDLVERVVEALEALQTAVLDQGETPGDRAFAAN